MRILDKDELKEKFISIMNMEENFHFEDGNPFLIEIYDKSFFIYIKNLSSAYFKGSPDITRVQLPSNDIFLKKIGDVIPFIILGYDIENDVYVNWNPAKIRQRLNTKKNVSLYSRKEYQKNIIKGVFKEGVLSTGEKFIIFDRQMLPAFFVNPFALFEINSVNANELFETKKAVEKSVSPTGMLTEITDKILLNQIAPLLEGNRVLEAATMCHKYYEGQLKNMGIKQWLSLVNSLHTQLNTKL